jgi:hypothetical protein
MLSTCFHYLLLTVFTLPAGDNCTAFSCLSLFTVPTVNLFTLPTADRVYNACRWLLVQRFPASLCLQCLLSTCLHYLLLTVFTGPGEILVLLHAVNRIYSFLRFIVFTASCVEFTVHPANLQDAYSTVTHGVLGVCYIFASAACWLCYQGLLRTNFYSACGGLYLQSHLPPCFRSLVPLSGTNRIYRASVDSAFLPLCLQ